MDKRLVPYLMIIFFSLLISLPLFKPGFYTIHDDQQIARLFLYNKALFAGQFPVLWVDGLGFGYGYPLFIFYPPFSYILGEIYHLIGFGFIDSIKLVFFSSIIFSGLAMYICAREFYGRISGLVASLFYIFVPYRALDVYVRGALAESFSFVWLPLILWSFYKLQNKGNYVYLLLSGIFVALLMITHNLILLPFLFLLPFYLLLLIITSGNKKKTFINFSIAVLISTGLSAFFWLPSLAEKQYTIVDKLLLLNLANYNLHFVYPQQLWNWPWGFGGSAGLQSGISFKIGKIHIIISVLAVIFSLIFALKNKINPKYFNFKIYLTITFFMLLIFSAFMTTFYSKFIWDYIQPLQYLQFPWRFLTFTALFSSLLAGAFIYLLRIPILKITAVFILTIALFVPNFKLFKPEFYRPNLTDATATSKDEINWYVSVSSYEYIPNGIKLNKNNLGNYMPLITKESIPKEKVKIINGNTTITNLNINPSKITLTTQGPTDSQVLVNNFNFPDWQATIDGKRTEIFDNNDLKLITLKIPPGTHQININFKNTPMINFANTISLLTLLSTVAFFILRREKYITV